MLLTLVGSQKIYSICITNYNSNDSIRQSIKSVYPLLVDEKFETVVVDNFSNDGSFEYLSDLFNQKIITHLISLRCNRGIGRNQAFKSSSGQYILANIDMDVIYDYKKILSAIKEYHSRFEGKVLSVYGMMIIPQKIANLLQGWKNLDRHEDNEIALNAFVHNLHAQDLSINIVKEHLNRNRDLVSRFKVRYQHYRDFMRIGFRSSDANMGELFRVEFILALLFYRLKPSFRYREFSEYFKIWKSQIVYGEVSKNLDKMEEDIN